MHFNVFIICQYFFYWRGYFLQTEFISNMFLFYATVIHFIVPPVRFSVFSSYIGLPGKKRFELIISACHFVVAFFFRTLFIRDPYLGTRLLRQPWKHCCVKNLRTRSLRLLPALMPQIALFRICLQQLSKIDYSITSVWWTRDLCSI